MDANNSSCMKFCQVEQKIETNPFKQQTFGSNSQHGKRNTSRFKEDNTALNSDSFHTDQDKKSRKDYIPNIQAKDIDIDYQNENKIDQFRPSPIRLQLKLGFKQVNVSSSDSDSIEKPRNKEESDKDFLTPSDTTCVGDSGIKNNELLQPKCPKSSSDINDNIQKQSSRQKVSKYQSSINEKLITLEDIQQNKRSHQRNSNLGG